VPDPAPGNPPGRSDREVEAMTSTVDAPFPTASRARTSSPLAEQVGDAIRRHLAGDETAVADLTRQVRPWLHHVVRAYRLPGSTVEDVVQTTLMALLVHIHELRDPTAGLSWLSVVARREALREIRSERRYVLVDAPETLQPDPTTGDTEDSAIASLTRAVVRRNVGKLPVRHRQLLERIAQQDRPDYAAISEALHMPLGSIGPTRKRVLEKMRRLLAADPEWDAEVPA
jgi:RNA polymerase sigma factor (sigma-70 family)